MKTDLKRNRSRANRSATKPSSKRPGKSSSSRKRSKPKSKSSPKAADQFTLNSSHGFVALLLKRASLENLLMLKNFRRTQAGAPVHSLSVAELLVAIIFHFASKSPGSLQSHLLMLGMKISASNLSQRRLALPWVVFTELMKLMLRPIGLKEEEQPDAYHKGLLLVAMDGTQFSLTNSEDINKRVPKARSRRGESAFAKLQSSVLIELRNRNPLAARVGRNGESEWVLGLEMLDFLPDNVMLLADRLYGCGAFLMKAMEALKARNGHFLVRVKGNLKVSKVLKRHKDGSRTVEVDVRDPEKIGRAHV